MAFGIPNSGENSGGEILPRVQYDARVGYWKTIDRLQGPEGWASHENDIPTPFSAVFLFHELEVGYIKFANPPGFALVQFGGAIPPQPDELNNEGRKAYQPGFRLKMFAPKTLGGIRVFANNSKTVLGAMDTLHQAYLAAPEAKQGLLPVVAVTGKQVIEVKNKNGSAKFYVPVFAIQKWVDRASVKTGNGAPAQAPSQAPQTAPQAPRPTSANHAPPPSAPPPTAPHAEPPDEMPW